MRTLRVNRLSARQVTTAFLAVMISIAPASFPAGEFVTTDQSRWFPFTIPDLASEASDRSEIDLSFLNSETAGAHGFLRARGEDIVDDRGTPVRLFGVNITDYHPLMPKEYAQPAARRLRELGVNFVRLHYFDWSKAPAGILNDDLQTLNPEKLDQLDWLVFNLERNGIYVDLNLHVARGFTNLPRGWNEMGKGIDMLHEPLIRSELAYARELVSHTNPYTKLRYADDPGIAVIEINNENTALREWNRYADLADEFRKPLESLWNVWLTKRYGTTVALAKAWGEGYSAGPEIIRNGDLSAGTDEWKYEMSGGKGACEVIADASAPNGRYLRWDVSEPGSATWNHQLQQLSTPMKHGKPYTMSFSARAKSGGNRQLELSVMMQAAPWKNVAGPTVVDLTDTWKTYYVEFEVYNPDEKAVRLNLNCNNRTGTIDLAAFTCREGSPASLAENETLEARSIPLVGAAAATGKKRDFVRFLLEREMNYIERFRTLLVNALSAKQIIYCTQVTYGGGAGIVRETTLGDAIDCHAYPSHPFKTEIAGKTVWGVRNVSMTGDAFQGLTDLAYHRVAGKPYLVTEFDLNPPNDFACQEFPLVATAAAYQGWSGILDYVWYNFNAGPGTTNMKSVWHTAGHSGQVAFMPAAALMFRLGLVRKASRVVTLSVPRDAAVNMTAANTYGFNNPDWGYAGVSEAASWCAALALQLTDGDGRESASEKLAPAAASKLISDTGEIVFDRAMKGAEVLTVNAPGVRMATGSVSGKRIALGDVTMSFGTGLHRDFAQACLAALDGQPIARSKRMFLTLASRVENRNMAYTKDRSACQWGEAPVMAEPVPITLALPGNGWHVWSLDGNGCRQKELQISGTAFTARPDDATMWYLFIRD